MTTTKPGTGFRVVQDENGDNRKEYAGKRAVVEVGFHSLRHTFVSICSENNIPLSVVQSIIGHTSPAMTAHYTHVGEQAAGHAISLLPDITKANTKALPAKTDPFSKATIRKLVGNMTGDNWQDIKAEVMKLASE